MEGTYPLLLDGARTGEVRVDTEGGWTVFDVQSEYVAGVVRVSVYGAGREGYLGVLAPEGEALTLHRRLCEVFPRRSNTPGGRVSRRRRRRRNRRRSRRNRRRRSSRNRRRRRKRRMKRRRKRRATRRTSTGTPRRTARWSALTGRKTASPCPRGTRASRRGAGDARRPSTAGTMWCSARKTGGCCPNPSSFPARRGPW